MQQGYKMFSANWLRRATKMSSARRSNYYYEKSKHCSATSKVARSSVVAKTNGRTRIRSSVGQISKKNSYFGYQNFYRSVFIVGSWFRHYRHHFFALFYEIFFNKSNRVLLVIAVRSNGGFYSKLRTSNNNTRSQK